MSPAQTPAQRLAEWLDSHPTGGVEIAPPTHGRQSSVILYDSPKARPEFKADTRNEAITAALDAWQKGDG